MLGSIWVVVKIMVPFWVPNIVRHLIFRVPKWDHNFDNHPFASGSGVLWVMCLGAHWGVDQDIHISYAAAWDSSTTV